MGRSNKSESYIENRKATICKAKSGQGAQEQREGIFKLNWGHRDNPGKEIKTGKREKKRRKIENNIQQKFENHKVIKKGGSKIWLDTKAIWK